MFKCKGRPRCSYTGQLMSIYSFLFTFFVAMTQLLLILFLIFFLFWKILLLDRFSMDPLHYQMITQHLPLNFSHKNVIIDGDIYDYFWLHSYDKSLIKIIMLLQLLEPCQVGKVAILSEFCVLICNLSLQSIVYNVKINMLFQSFNKVSKVQIVWCNCIINCISCEHKSILF